MFFCNGTFRSTISRPALLLLLAGAVTATTAAAQSNTEPTTQTQTVSAPQAAANDKPCVDTTSMPGMSMPCQGTPDQAMGAMPWHMSMPTLFGGPFHAMAAEGSGTSIVPASTDTYMFDFMKGKWMLMAHGQALIDYNQQGGPRSPGGKIESHNWAMFSAEHALGRGSIQWRGMFTLEPLTTPERGFPELFQTGETWHGRPIIDAQHPHNAFAELSVGYVLPVNHTVSFSLYGGPVAEPALGPTAFMHRLSSVENPVVPIVHHWQDSTHISEGVITGGVMVGRFKAEASLFHGAEPGENRWVVDPGKLDSWSGRIWYIPAKDWALQTSYGVLTKPEALEPGNVIRTTASVMHNHKWHDGYVASSLIWGRNRQEMASANSYLLESTVNFLDRDYAFYRVELVDKTGLFQTNIWDKTGLIDATDVMLDQAKRVGSYTFGGTRDVIATAKVRVGLGGAMELYSVPSALVPVYSAHPVSFQLFVRIRTGKN